MDYPVAEAGAHYLLGSFGRASVFDMEDEQAKGVEEEISAVG